MDSNQSTDNKRDFDAVPLQNQDDDDVPGLSDGGSAKRFKEEELDPLKTGSIHYLQSQKDDNVLTLMETDGASIEKSQAELDPFQIGSILEKVFSNLDVASIKNARQVNALWSIEGAKMLITKSYLKIPSDLRLEPINSKLMDEFKAFLSHKSSDHSMIPNITIDIFGDVEVWKSLGVLGEQVESLKFNTLNVKIAEMFHKLLHLLPNLKYLDITTSKRFECQWSNWWLHIIKALNNVMSAAEKHQSSLVISFMHLEPANLEQLESIEKFADCNNILIEELEFSLNPYRLIGVPNLGIRISNFMGKLLSRSRNILKSLTLNNRTSFLPLLEFPSLPALTYLELECKLEVYNPLQPIKFSPTFRFSETVPNLIHFKCNLLDPRPLPLPNLFEQTGTAPSVKILEYCHSLRNTDIKPLLLTFPNIEEYKATGGVNCSQKIFESLWTHGVNLRKLSIEIQNYGTSKGFVDLDPFITGFTQETVDKIKKTPNLAPYPLEEMEQLRVNPSILNLKRLDHFAILFWDLKQNDIQDRFLAAAGEYAFKLMPKNSRIFLNFQGGYLGREGDRNSLLDEVSKLPNVSVKIGW